MKFALIDGEKREAERGINGVCLGCGQLMRPVCGAIRVRHWRHKVDCDCDHWWENETEWHREWKGYFPSEWQEVRHKDYATGEWHIADVKTDRGYVLEFQHSFLKSEERKARNDFYGENLVWVVDGTKRKKDRSSFDAALKETKQMIPNTSIVKLSAFVGDCPLLRDWSDCNVPVFFDFGSDVPLWCLMPKTAKKSQYIFPYLRQNFISLHNGLLNGKCFSDFNTLLFSKIFAHENPELVVAAKHSQIQSKQPPIVRRQIMVPRLSLRDLNYLVRPPRRQFKKYRK
ncbi:MAG: hypothetical protein KDD50_03535 [Bdellovibrionales bacterium]|nr:hypothetical protein [Bdellovibrionales bacterium]